MPREWTDRADASPYAELGIGALVVDFEHLLAVAELIEDIVGAGNKGVDT